MTFVYGLEHRPKRKAIETVCWEKQQQLSIDENKKYLLKIACDSLLKKYPPLRSIKKIQSKEFFFTALSCMATGVTFSDRLKKNTTLDNIKATTLLYAHSIKEVTLMPYYLKVLREEPKRDSPLFCFVDQQPNAIERFNTSVLMLTHQKGGEGDGCEFVGGGKRKRDKKKWKDAVIVDWSGETKEYEVRWKDRPNNNQSESFPRTSFSAGDEDILVEFWESFGKEVKIAEEDLRSEIEKQIEEGKHCEEKIACLERNGGKIVNCVIVERRGKQSRRVTSARRCKFYKLKNSKGFEVIWVENQDIKKKSLLLDYWEGVDEKKERGKKRKERGGDERGKKRRR